MRKLLISVFTVSLAGCATNGARSTVGYDPPPAAKRIYAAAEAQIEQGGYDDGARLLRHALLQLPHDERGDWLRHQLILRIAHVELLAWSQAHERAHLEDARQMLVRYLERHEALFGDEERARAERGEVYELLYEVERRLDGPEEPFDEDEIEEDDGPADAQTLPGGDAGAAPRVATAALDSVSSSDQDVRVVEVRSSRRPRLEDPGMQEKLSGIFHDPGFAAPQYGLVTTKVDYVQLHGPRPLVRLVGSPSTADEHASARERRQARALGRALVQAARPGLRRCFMAAFARQPRGEVQSTIEASIHADGSVTAVQLVDGGLIDAFGDVCVIDRLQSTQVEPAEVEAPQRVRLALSFFLQGPVTIHESSGRVDESFEPTSTEPRGCRDPELLKPGRCS